MNLFLTNPWLFIITIIWIVCGAVSIRMKSTEAIEAAGFVSMLLGIFYCIIHKTFD